MNATPCSVDLGADKVIVSTFYSVVFAVGLPTNSLALWSLYRVVKANRKPYVYLLNLLAADLTHIILLPLWINYVINEHQWHFGDVMCKITGFTFYLNMYTSILFLNCISLDRFFAIVYPLRYHWLHRKTTQYAISACVWTLALVCNTPGFMYAEVNEVSKLCYESYPLSHTYTVYRLFFTSFVFFPACFIFFFTFVAIQRSVRRSSTLERAEVKKIQNLLLAVLLMFVFIFGPFHLAYFYRVIMTLVGTDVCQAEIALYVYFKATCAFVSLNNIIDPLLYIFISKDVQRKFTGLFKGHCSGQGDSECHEHEMREQSRRVDVSSC